VNKVLLTGRLTRDPELRRLASGKTVTQERITVILRLWDAPSDTFARAR
jgi:single-stranded DNA-binding protein